MLQGIARLAVVAPRRVIAAAALVFVAAAIFGTPVADSLSGGGYRDPASESSRADKLLTDKFGQSDNQMLVVVTAPDDAGSGRARQTGTDIANRLKRSPFVFNVSSAWTSPPEAAAQLVSKDGRSGLIVANLKGDENNAHKYAKTLLSEIETNRDGVTVEAGGTAIAYEQLNQLAGQDPLLIVAIALPLCFLVLVWAFGGLMAAALPIAVGGLAIVGTMSVLRLITFSTDVSIAALRLSLGMGLALAIDYTLLITSRYREERSRGTVEEALICTVATAGRTVLFSATTVALSVALMVLFPMNILKSVAYAGVATVAFVAVATIVVTPAALVLLGPRLDSLDVRSLTRRVFHRSEPSPKQVEQLFFYRSTKLVMRHALPMGLAVVTLLMLLGTPFLGAKWGISDDRVLPPSASAHRVGDLLRNDFAYDAATTLTVVIPDARGLTPADLEHYAADLSQVRDVTAVSTPTGTFVAGNNAGPPSSAAGVAEGSAFLTVATSAPLFSPASDAQLDQLHNVSGPGGRPVEMAGWAQINRDTTHAVVARIPLVLGLIGFITFVLLFVLTGSVVLPAKALVLNALSLTAAFGALVWIFQEGHFNALGTTPTGTLIVAIPVLLFCVAFGLSMDYEVFLLSRIREYWLSAGATLGGFANTVSARERNAESVALGLARTGRVITAAALVMAISFALPIASGVAFLRMVGVGLTLAVLMDATLVRMVLVPALMQLVGPWNWWAPKPLVWLHERVGVSESGAPRQPAPKPGPTLQSDVAMADSAE